MNSVESDASNESLDTLRGTLARGDNATQAQLDAIAEEIERFRGSLEPLQPNEILGLVSSDGSPLNLAAPRWLCHLLGLRHACSHVLLSWHSPSLGNVFILQIRSWNKPDSPGHVDISVGGHIRLGFSATETAYAEMKQELGVAQRDLHDETLYHIGCYESFNQKPDESFYNAEWREVYAGELVPDKFARIQFRDKEVAGLYLCPEAEAGNLLNQQNIPLASSLIHSLPMCLGQVPKLQVHGSSY